MPPTPSATDAVPELASTLVQRCGLRYHSNSSRKPNVRRCLSWSSKSISLVMGGVPWGWARFLAEFARIQIRRVEWNLGILANSATVGWPGLEGDSRSPGGATGASLRSSPGHPSLLLYTVIKSAKLFGSVGSRRD